MLLENEKLKVEVSRLNRKLDEILQLLPGDRDSYAPISAAKGTASVARSSDQGEVQVSTLAGPPVLPTMAAEPNKLRLQQQSPII